MNKLKNYNEPVVDDPFYDGTDAAHPAWWRGHDHTTEVFCQLVNAILDGQDDGHGFNYEPWGYTRQRLLMLVKNEQRDDTSEKINKAS